MVHAANVYYNFYDHTGAVSRADALAAAGYKFIASLGESGGYDWATVDVFRNIRTGRLVWYSDSGCSCYGPYDYPDEDTGIEIDDYRSFRDQVKQTSAFMSYSNSDTQRSFLRKVQRQLRK